MATGEHNGTRKISLFVCEQHFIDIEFGLIFFSLANTIIWISVVAYRLCHTVTHTTSTHSSSWPISLGFRFGFLPFKFQRAQRVCKVWVHFLFHASLAFHWRLSPLKQTNSPSYSIEFPIVALRRQQNTKWMKLLTIKSSPLCSPSDSRVKIATNPFDSIVLFGHFDIEQTVFSTLIEPKRCRFIIGWCIDARQHSWLTRGYRLRAISTHHAYIVSLYYTSFMSHLQQCHPNQWTLLETL